MRMGELTVEKPIDFLLAIGIVGGLLFIISLIIAPIFNVPEYQIVKPYEEGHWECIEPELEYLNEPFYVKEVSEYICATIQELDSEKKWICPKGWIRKTPCTKEVWVHDVLQSKEQGENNG